jgi:hypothetical protein
VPLLYLSLAARSLSFPALITPAISIFAPKTMYRIVGPRICTQSKSSWSSVAAAVDLAAVASFSFFWFFRTRFMYWSADTRAPLNERPCLVSTIKSIPTKYLKSAARLVVSAGITIGSDCDAVWFWHSAHGLIMQLA